MSTPLVSGGSRLPNTFLGAPASEEGRLDFLEYWRTLLKRKWAILGFAAVITLVAGVIAFVSTPIYEAKTVLLIETSKQKIVSIEDVYGGAVASREFFQTQIEILKSREVAYKTIAKLKLYDQPEFDPRAPATGLSAYIEQLGFANKEPLKEFTEQKLIEAAYGRFSGNLVIEPLRQSQMVFVKFTSSDAALAARVSNAVAQTFIENDLDAKYQMARTASAWLEDRLTGLKTKLNESEQALQGYREKQGLLNIKDSSQSGAGLQLGELQSRLIEARAKRAEAEATYNLIKNASGAGNLGSIPTVLNSTQVAEAKRLTADATKKLTDVAQRYGKEHPRYVQAEAEAKVANSNLQRQIELVAASIMQDYERARGTEKAIESAYNASRGTIQNINRKEFELGKYEREVEANRQMYDMFMKRAKETNITGDLQTTVARVIDSAMVPGSPIKPDKRKIVLVALLMGLIVGAGLALLLDVIDNTLKNSDDVESRLKQPLLTVLPLLSKKDAMRSNSGHLVIDSPNSLYSEAIRTARTGVLLSSVDVTSRVLLITSSNASEGKTTFSSNLALAHAFTQKTLLIDADMRRPSVARSHGLDAKAQGLSELVAGTAKLADCLQPVKDSNLMILGSGTIPPNPLELLHSERFSKTIEELRRHFEMIIIDSPPVELVSDALVLSAKADGVIFVTKAQTTPVPMIRRALQHLQRADANVIGVVLNALDFKKADKYYGEYSGYGKHGYGAYGNAYGQSYAASTAKK
ncbi:polysaccharide biosynthesis tyrosine autokinase [Rhodoferax sp.]|uniref:GumC family protein n=1 Tax=Rhodoferax sp. TaxID=50421 RepID=UPI0026024965|nr:polysaccharide biosynthesis tyrosine autokinase [Rhodoferax sp.]MDD2808194.1 polysaccharide biosynthesis tyrosine autokinase [Rhodoferax sp.]